MIHDDLIRHFRSLPEPQFPAGFSARLRQRLDAAGQPRRLTTAVIMMRRWVSRVYWIGAAVLVLKTVRPPVFTLEQMVAMALIALLAVLALQRALGPTALTRILRDALLR